MNILEEMTALMELCMKLSREALYAYVTAGNHACEVWVMRGKPDGGFKTLRYWDRRENLNGGEWMDEMKNERTSFDAIVRELEALQNG